MFDCFEMRRGDEIGLGLRRLATLRTGGEGKGEG